MGKRARIPGERWVSEEKWLLKYFTNKIEIFKCVCFDKKKYLKT